jgi:hypothetical protein
MFQKMKSRQLLIITFLFSLFIGAHLEGISLSKVKLKLKIEILFK